jgi:hypothetical protein
VLKNHPTTIISVILLKSELLLTKMSNEASNFFNVIRSARDPTSLFVVLSLNGQRSKSVLDSIVAALLLGVGVVGVVALLGLTGSSASGLASELAVVSVSFVSKRQVSVVFFKDRNLVSLTCHCVVGDHLDHHHGCCCRNPFLFLRGPSSRRSLGFGPTWQRVLLRASFAFQRREWHRRRYLPWACWHHQWRECLKEQYEASSQVSCALWEEIGDHHEDQCP